MSDGSRANPKQSRCTNRNERQRLRPRYGAITSGRASGCLTSVKNRSIFGWHVQEATATMKGTRYHLQTFDSRSLTRILRLLMTRSNYDAQKASHRYKEQTKNREREEGNSRSINQICFQVPTAKLYRVKSVWQIRNRHGSAATGRSYLVTRCRKLSGTASRRKKGCLETSGIGQLIEHQGQMRK